ncbi:hypothetical protein IB229_15510 [Pseudomonas sp. PDM14]|uniref:hypothetical protein n=1 Tax=Pseudomonas sp. PDM14 TaxID=2769288 RepID=UPI0017818CFD|nr:hypothetical protein [Pseudomonas sp. PDM14]MBD9484393.1 hypothetical protein [Pseudomonas sp. PDM14]
MTVNPCVIWWCYARDIAKAVPFYFFAYFSMICQFIRPIKSGKRQSLSALRQDQNGKTAKRQNGKTAKRAGCRGK